MRDYILPNVDPKIFYSENIVINLLFAIYARPTISQIVEINEKKRTNRRRRK